MFTLKKIERLSSKKDIALLYSSGTSKTIFPLKIYWRENSFVSQYPLRVLISVPKRIHKKAVDRNLIKRRIKEAYRLQKHPFYESLLQLGKQTDVMILYTSKDIARLPELMKAIHKALLFVVEEIKNKNTPNNVKEE